MGHEPAMVIGSGDVVVVHTRDVSDNQITPKVRAMIAHLSQGYRLSAEDAYVLTSLCVDLKISEIVDAGQYIVSALLPLAVFR